MLKKVRDDTEFIENMFKKTNVFCGDCDAPMHVRYDTKLHKKIYRCIYHPKCKGMAAATRYRVTPGDQATREARYVAHKELEAFFKNKEDEHHFVSVYGPKAHIGHMNQREIQTLMQKFYSFKKDEISLYIWKELKHYL